MKKDFTLEKHKFFPYIAWVLVGCFAVFTYTLATDLNNTSDELIKQTQRTLSAVNSDTIKTQ